MDPITLAILLGGAGLVKEATLGADKERRDRTLAAETQRYSPWTGLKAGGIKEADPFGSALQGGFGGFALGSSIQSAEADNALKRKQAQYLDRNTGRVKASDAQWKTGFEPNEGPRQLSPWGQMRQTPRGPVMYSKDPLEEFPSMAPGSYSKPIEPAFGGF